MTVPEASGASQELQGYISIYIEQNSLKSRLRSFRSFLKSCYIELQELAKIFFEKN
jgi:hypothetical protein